MFGHLDDPEGIAPGDREMANVIRRAGVIRARRRVGAVAACLVVIAGTAGFVASRPSAVRLASSETGYQFNAMKGPLPVGTPVPTTALVNVVFDDARNGFALAAHQGAAVLAQSTDGGNSWRVENGALPSGYGESDGYPGQFEFIRSNGYLWGGAPRADGSSPLWITTDRGATWRQAPIGPVVYDVSAIGDNVWALTRSCGAGPDSASSAAPCALGLELSLDGGASWNAVGSSGLTGTPNIPPAAQRVELARITSRRSYILTSSASPLSHVIGLVYTSDAGVTWQTRPVPCGGAFDLGAEIAASGTNDLWLLCGSDASAGSQSKELYRSGDGGVTWTLTAKATGLGSPSPPASRPNTLPLAGYIAPFSVGHKNLAVLSPTTAWLYPFRTSLFATQTGGQAWGLVPGLSGAGFGTGGAGNVTFISASQGWICAYGVGLWHTSDGVHWAVLGI